MNHPFPSLPFLLLKLDHPARCRCFAGPQLSRRAAPCSQSTGPIRRPPSTTLHATVYCFARTGILHPLRLDNQPFSHLASTTTKRADLDHHSQALPPSYRLLVSTAATPTQTPLRDPSRSPPCIVNIARSLSSAQLEASSVSQAVIIHLQRGIDNTPDPRIHHVVEPLSCLPSNARIRPLTLVLACSYQNHTL